MSRISRPPLGLQDLLDSRNFGVNPSELLQGVRPTLPLSGLYKWPKLIRETSSLTGVNALNQNTDVEVPNNEIWEVVNVACRMQNAAAVGAKARAGLRLQTIGAEISGGGSGLRNAWLKFGPESLDIFDATATGVSYGTDWQAPENFFVGPGSIFQAFVVDLDLNAGTSITIYLDVLYYRLTF